MKIIIWKIKKNLNISNLIQKKKDENITGILGLGLFDNSENLDKSFLKTLEINK